MRVFSKRLRASAICDGDQARFGRVENRLMSHGRSVLSRMLSAAVVGLWIVGYGSRRVTVVTRSIARSKEAISPTPVASAWATR